MKRKTSTVPTRIYTYGCRAPTLNAEIVDQQIRLGRVYRNKLIEIELERRKAYREITCDAAVQAVDERIAALDNERKELRLAIKATRAEKRGRAVATAPVRARIKAIGEEIAGHKAERARLRTLVREDPEVAVAIERLDVKAAEAVRTARGASGLYWGNYLLVEKAHEQIRASKTDPQFRRWDGAGRVGVQLQGGLVLDKLATDSRLQIVPVAAPAVRPSARPRGPNFKPQPITDPRRLWQVRLRVGTVKGGNAPIWAEFPLTMHRPLPLDASIKWAWVSRTRIGVHWRWNLQIALESTTFRRKDEPGRGTVAIDVGWRLRPDGSLRVGYFYDDQGKHGEIKLPGKHRGIADRLAHADSLRAIYTQAFDRHRGLLVAWLANNTHAPAWLTEAAAYLSQWKAPTRLAQLVAAWRTQRFTGDAEIYETLAAWRTQYLHLYEWEASERVKTLAYRQHIYRRLAVDFVTRYHTVVFEDFDLRAMQARPEPESPREESPLPVKYLQRAAAISELRRIFGEYMTAATVPAPGTTITCADCHAQIPSPGAELLMTCPSCERTWDQDDNAARMILQRHFAAPPDDARADADASASVTTAARP